jgi:hypothetical protein
MKHCESPVTNMVIVRNKVVVTLEIPPQKGIAVIIIIISHNLMQLQSMKVLTLIGFSRMAIHALLQPAKTLARFCLIVCL